MFFDNKEKVILQASVMRNGFRRSSVPLSWLPGATVKHCRVGQLRAFVVYTIMIHLCVVLTTNDDFWTKPVQLQRSQQPTATCAGNRQDYHHRTSFHPSLSSNTATALWTDVIPVFESSFHPETLKISLLLRCKGEGL